MNKFLYSAKCLLSFVIIFSTLIQSTAFSEETTLTQAEKDYIQAENLRKDKKFPEAKNLYQSVSQDSDSSLALKSLTGVGLCEIQLGDKTAAGQAAEKIKANYSQHPDLCLKLEELSYEYWKVKDFADSKALGQYIIQQSPGSDLAIRAQRGIARCALRQKNKADADKVVEKLKTHFAQHPKLYKQLNILAYEYGLYGDYDKGKSICEYVLQNSSDTISKIKAQAQIARWGIDSGDYTAANQAITALMNGYSASEELCTSLLKLAKKYGRLKNFDKAKSLCQYVSQNSSDNSQAFTARTWAGCIEIKLGNDSSADHIIEGLKTNYPNPEKLYKSISILAKDYSGVGKYKKAKSLYNYIIQNSTDSNQKLDSHACVVGCEIKSGNESAAIQAFDDLWAAYGSEEGFIDKLLSICDTFIGVNDPAPAVTYINKALETLPNDGDAIRLLKTKAECYINMGAGDQAEAVIDQIIADHPNHEKCYRILNSIAKSYRANDDYPKCISLYKQVLNTASRDLEKHEALAGLAKAKVHSEGLADTSQVDAIVDYMVNNKETFPRVGYHMFQIGEEYFVNAHTADSKNREQRNELYRKALSIWEKNINEITDAKHKCYAYYYSGLSCRSLKEYDKGLFYFHKVLNEFPENEHTASALFMIGRVYQKKPNASPKITGSISYTNTVADPNGLESETNLLSESETTDPSSTLPTSLSLEADDVIINSIEEAFEQLVGKYPSVPSAAYARRWLIRNSSK